MPFSNMDEGGDMHGRKYKQRLYPLSGINQACNWQFIRHFSRKDAYPCLCKTLAIIAIAVAFFLFNAALIVGFSYAINGKTYNMSTGCLFTDTQCNQTLSFYAHGDLGHLAGWSSMLTLIECALLLVVLAVSVCVTSYCKQRYKEYTLSVVNELPNTPMTAYDGENFNLDLDSDEEISL